MKSNPSRCLALALGMLALLACDSNATAQVLTRRTMAALKTAPVNEEQYRSTIELGPDTKLGAAIDITSKGNGALRIANLNLKVVDGHDDGALYDRSWAHIEFADIDDDGWKDLVVSGIVNYTDDKTEEILEREPFTFIYRYDPARAEFRRTYRRAGFRLEDGPEPRGAGERTDTQAACSSFQYESHLRTGDNDVRWVLDCCSASFAARLVSDLNDL